MSLRFPAESLNSHTFISTFLGVAPHTVLILTLCCSLKTLLALDLKLSEELVPLKTLHGVLHTASLDGLSPGSSP